MVHKLSQELISALHAARDDALEVVNPENNRVYFVVDGDTHRRAMDALRRQSDLEAIARGLAQMEAGEGTALDLARRQVREKLVSRNP